MLTGFLFVLWYNKLIMHLPVVIQFYFMFLRSSHLTIKITKTKKKFQKLRVWVVCPGALGTQLLAISSMYTHMQYVIDLTHYWPERNCLALLKIICCNYFQIFALCSLRTTGHIAWLPEDVANLFVSKIILFCRCKLCTKKSR